MASPGTWGVLNFGPSALTVTPGSVVPVTTTTNITSAQLLALSTTPITVAPAPGVGQYLCPIYMILEYTYGGTAYTSGAHTQDCFLNWGGQVINSSNAIALYNWANATTGIIEATQSCIFLQPCGNGLMNMSVIANNSVIFGAPNPVTLGNGTLKVILTYVVLPV